MTKIVDPDALNQSTEIVFDTALKTIQLLVAGNLDDGSPGSDSGVTLQAVYSFCKEEWKTDTTLNKFRFPLDAITASKMDLVNGWDWEDDQTKDLIRDGGWSLRDSGGISQEEYMGIISLGGVFEETTDAGYYQSVAGFDETTTAYDKTDEINEPVKIYGDASHGDVDYRTFFKTFLREQAKLFDEGNLLDDQKLSSLDYTVYKLPLVNATDIKVTTSDGNIETLSPYTGMTIDYVRGASFITWVSEGSYSIDDVVLDDTVSPGRWFRSKTDHSSEATAPNLDATNWEAYPGEKQIGTDYYAFNRLVDGNAGTLEEIYEFLQYKLRQITDINDDGLGETYGTVYGNVAVLLAGFLGDTLQSNPGTLIDNFDVNDMNRIQMFDITVDGGGLDDEDVPVTSTAREYPFVSAGTLVFNSQLVDDSDAEFTMYFTTNPTGDFDTVNAVIVQDADDTDIKSETITDDIDFTFDYDNNEQGGRTKGTDAPVTVVAMGLDGAQWVIAQFTITKATGLTFPVNAAQERNYSNPT